MKKNKKTKKYKGLADFMVKKKISPTTKSANQTLVLISIIMLLFSIWTLKDTSYLKIRANIDDLEASEPWQN